MAVKFDCRPLLSAMNFFFTLFVLVAFQILFSSATTKYEEEDFDFNDVFGEIGVSSEEGDLDEDNILWPEKVLNEYQNFKLNFEEDYYSLASSSEYEKNCEDDKFEIPARWTVNSIKIISPEAFREINLRAAVMLIYGFDKDHSLYYIAKNYIDFCFKFKFNNNFDPNIGYSYNIYSMFGRHGFDLESLDFRAFCDYISYHEMPKTSPLYVSKKVISFREKWLLQREALLNFASNEIMEIFNGIDINQFKEELDLGKTYEDNEAVELVINMLKTKVPKFLSSAANQDGNFSQIIESFIWNVIVDGCALCKIGDKAVHIKMEEELRSKLLPALDLIYNYNDLRKIDQDADLNFSYFIIQ